MGRRWIGGRGREERAKAGVSPGRRIGRGWPGASARVRVFNLFYLLAAEIGRRRRVARLEWIGRRWPRDRLRVRVFNFYLWSMGTGGGKRGECALM